MNTNDAVHDLGGKCTNFLDTGGKATSETVKASFRIILMDARVKTIFVNIFGGLTLCDMIAEGIILAYKVLDIKLPVVVRLRGTNEEIGQKMVRTSFLLLSRCSKTLKYLFRSPTAVSHCIPLTILKRPRGRLLN